MRYEIPYVITECTAKNKAQLLSFVPPIGREHTDINWIAIEAASDAEAYTSLLKLIFPNDERPIRGKTNVKLFRITPEIKSTVGGLTNSNRFSYQIGDRVILHKPYVGCGDTPCNIGVISEVISSIHYSINLEGYNNPYVDFSTREFASEPVR